MPQHIEATELSTTAEEMQELLRLARNATPGPRIVLRNRTNTSISTGAYQDGGRQIMFVHRATPQSHADADFHAAASPDRLIHILTSALASMSAEVRLESQTGRHGK